MTPTTRSLIVITGPRAVVAELVLLLESPELGRRPGDPPLPMVPPTGRDRSGPRRQVAAVRDRAPAPAAVTGPQFASPGRGLLEVRYTVTAHGSSAAAVAELARRIPEIDVVLTETTPDGHTDITVHRDGRQGSRRLLAVPTPPAGATRPPASGRRPRWAGPRTPGGTRG